MDYIISPLVPFQLFLGYRGTVIRRKKYFVKNSFKIWKTVEDQKYP
jgi:hypothetical protein